MKQILVILDDLKNSGIPHFFLNYLSNIEKKDLGITIACDSPKEPFFVERFQKEKIELKNLCNRRRSLYRHCRELSRILKHGFYDTIHINGNSGTMFFDVFIAKKHKIKNIYVHCHNTSCSHPLIFGPKSVFTKLMCKFSTEHFACSEAAGNWLFGNNYIILHNAIDVESFRYSTSSRNEIRELYRLPKDAFIIGTVGRINNQKNQIFLIEILYCLLKKNINCYLMLIGGDGGAKESVVSLCKKFNILDRVVFCGETFDVNKYYSALDFFVFPSRYEGFGMAAIEAQASGLPCLVSDVLPQSVCCSSKLVFFSLNKSATQWADKILDMNSIFGSETRTVPQDLSANGFDVIREAHKLRNFYLK